MPPASMTVRCDWNWYLSHWLEWLPRVGEERDAAPPIHPSAWKPPDEP
jgi:hypothetical protein